MHNQANKDTIILEKDSHVNVMFGAPEGQDARILINRARELMREDKVLIHIAMDDTRVSILRDLIEFFALDVKTLFFPAWDCLPYDRVSPSHDISAARVGALSALIKWDAEQERKPRILLTTLNAAVQRTMPRSALDGASFTAKAGGRFDREGMTLYLVDNGYTRTETVREQGEYAMRGGIIDIYPSGMDTPVRIDLFGDEIETIRTFDPISQRSIEKVKDFTLQPVTEFFLDEKSIAKFRAGYRDAFGVVDQNDPLYESVTEARRYNGMDHWQPLFYNDMASIFEYAPENNVTFDPHIREAYDERWDQIDDFYQARKTLEQAAIDKGRKTTDLTMAGAIYHPLPPEALYLNESEWGPLVDGASEFSNFKAPDDDRNDGGGRKGRDFADIRALPDGDIFAELKKHIASLKTADRKVAIACYSLGSMERMKGLLENAGIEKLEICEKFEALKKLKPEKTALIILNLEHGFVANDLAIITEQDILGDRLARKSSKKRKADNFLTEVSSLEEGDIVVHLDHGIGRFVELETLKAAKTFHDCLKIEYAGGDRLYVPVENIEVLSRFGSDESTVQLDKLGGAGWQARKAKAKENLMVMAEQLLEIAAARKLKKAEKLDADIGIYNEFAAKFPYTETEDQERAINDVIADLASEHPMDRLICGDVGFGKTEVAIRAAYVAAIEGAQVALVVPTTLLARQHYQNFITRFKGTGLRVEQLSRLVATKDAKKTKEGLADGSVNIVIGTHALFSKNIKFAHLGLMIVDEEQRFGVKQKERLKELKKNIHILTLTATPIPRTLQMSLTGVKEMSLIATPPVDRLAIRTFVLPFDPMVIREAILREHYRGGQTFYVCPRIKDMPDIEKTLKELVPEVKVITAHGQMTPTELEDRMTAFYDGQYNILLATNIIESGIDIPTANTMIIHRADMFGLAQLYQIRGRIGRSKMRAYAYLTYPPRQKLNPQAQKRLEVMETLDTLGSGFQLASHDMDIRGAGNLLGDQQSGHIREIGVELYQQMLEEAVAAAKGDGEIDEQNNKNWSPNINLGTSVLIPDTYVEDLNVRMSLYRRISGLENTDEIESFAAELIDRFGEIPQEVNNLLDIVSIKQFCKKACISQVDAGPKGAVLSFHNDSPKDVGKLMAWMQSKHGAVKLRPDQKLVAIRQWDTAQDRVKGARNLVKEIANL